MNRVDRYQYVDGKTEQTARRHIPEDQNLNIDRHENLKYEFELRHSSPSSH